MIAFACLCPAPDRQGRWNGQQANHQKGCHLGPEKLVTDVVFPADRAENYADDPNHDHNARHRAIGRVNPCQLVDPETRKPRPQQRELGRIDGN
ncbi:hypothetical protein D3C87_1632970 [compost metagenome]